MQKILARLNPQQLAAVQQTSGPVLVLAGAGSGKTSVITSKIAYLIRNQGLKARNICALTFTNKAAKEMQTRVSQLLGKEETRGLKVSTFHSLGLDILRRETQLAGLKSGFSLFDSEDSRTLIKDLMHKDNQDDSDLVNQVQNLISNWKNALLEPGQLTIGDDDPAAQLAAKVYPVYNRHLLAYNAVDFDDLIRLPTLLFSTNQELLHKWQGILRYLLVDEYQDTNTSQYKLVRLLAGHRQNFTLVGDDDQSIYAWRGAQPENINLLSEDYPSLEVIKLEQNYRSTERILKAANQLISNNPHLHQKNLWSQLGYGEPIKVMEASNEEAEAERVAGEILTLKMGNHLNWKDFAVLYRSNFQSRILEIKLQMLQIPYKISGGTSFFARNEIKDVMAYLRLLVNPSDDNAFLRIINLPRRKIGPAILEKLALYAKERDKSLYEACNDIGLSYHLKEEQLARLQGFYRWLENIIYQCETSDPLAAINEMLEDIDYEAWLHATSSSPTQAERRQANVRVLIESLSSTLKKMQEDNEDAGIKDAIARLVLRDLLERQEEEDDQDRVQLLTLHASKGLEFPFVFLVGMEEELLPHKNSLEGAALEEERRLCYVGITRAKQVLTLSFAKERRAFGEKFDTTPSRFFDELPPEDLNWPGRNQETETPEEQKQRKQSRIAALQALLNS